MTRYHNETLRGILLAFLGILILTKLLSPGVDSNTAKEFAALDTEKISGIKFYIKGRAEGIELIRTKDDWQIMKPNMEGRAFPNAVRELLMALSEVRIDRLAGSEKNSWTKLYVNDTLANHMIVFAEGEVMADWYIGSPPQDESSYIRAKNDDKVYLLRNQVLARLSNKSFEKWMDKPVD